VVNQWRIFAFHHMCFVPCHAFSMHFCFDCAQSTLIPVPGRFHVPCQTYICLEKQETGGMFDHVLFMHSEGGPVSFRSQIFRVLPACCLLDQINIGNPRGKTFPAVDHHLLPPQSSQADGGGKHGWRASGEARGRHER
jgi:hypothetical protein